MKLAEIQVGTEYARTQSSSRYGRSGKAPKIRMVSKTPRELDPRELIRVGTPLPEFPCEVWAGGYDMEADEATPEVWRPVFLRARDFWYPWSEYEPVWEQSRANEIRLATERAAAQEKRASLAATLAGFGITTRPTFATLDVQISLFELERLVALIACEKCGHRITVTGDCPGHDDD